MSNSNDLLKQWRKQPLLFWGVGALVALAALYFMFGRTGTRSVGTTFVVKRGQLPISVLEGGSVEALVSQEIRSQIKGYQGTKILSIVEEGYLVTEDDIKNGKVLVELDSSELYQKITTQEISYQGTLATLIEAQQAYDIQKNQNESDLKAAEQKARFALMDFEKYMGKSNTTEIVEKLGLKIDAYTNSLEEAETELDTDALSMLQPSSTSGGPGQFPGMNPGAFAPNGDQPGRPDASRSIASGEQRVRRGDNGGARAMADSGANDQQAPDRVSGDRQPRGDRGASRSQRGDRAGGQPLAGAVPTSPGATATPGEMSGPPPGARLPMTGPRPVPALANNPDMLRALTNRAALAVAGGLRSTNAAFAPAINFTKYAKAELLGDGAAKQQLRKLEDDLLVAKQSKEVAQTRFEGTKRLFKEEFVNKMDLDNEELTVKQNEVRFASAQTSLDLYINYEFTRLAEDYLSKYDESLRLLVRARKEAISRLAQARARMKSAEGRFRLESTQMQEYKEQMTNCIIRAKRPGLVVYGSGSGDDHGFRAEEQIREGATVRERQAIITIPDMTQMAVRLKIHESHIKKIKKGLKAKIQVDAFPELKLDGEVIKVGVLPDSGNRWMNPDMKVYITSVGISGVYDWLKPGFTAKVDIKVKDLDDVLYVPIQAVVPITGKHYAFVETGVRTDQREIEVGEFNDEFIEIKKGLKEGEKVLLRAPEGTETGGEVKGDEVDQENGAAPQTPAAASPPATAPANPAAKSPRPAAGNRSPKP